MEAPIAAEAGSVCGAHEIDARPVSGHETLETNAVAPIDEAPSGVLDQEAAEIGRRHPGGRRDLSEGGSFLPFA